MHPKSDPAHAFVCIVGVEHASLFSDDPMIGPIADALRVFDWAVASGVPTARIRLFLSPKPASAELLESWRARQGDAVLSGADQAAIQGFVANELCKHAPPAPGLLVLAWSGHGVIETRSGTRQRVLFYADSTPAAPLHADLRELMATLASARFNGFSEQVLAIDACATWASSAFRAPLGAPSNFGVAGYGAVHQFAMAAASPGELAECGPDADGVVGSRFIQRLVHRLSSASQGCWPNFERAFRDTRRDFGGLDQTPVSWAWGHGGELENDDAREVMTTARTTRLLWAVGDAAIASELLEAAFVAALAPIVEVASHAHAARAGCTAMIDALHLAAIHDDQRPPLHRLALEIVARVPGAAAAGVQQWLRSEGLAPSDIDAEAARRRRDRARPAARFLLIEETRAAPGDDAVVLNAWLFVGNDPTPRPVVRQDDSPFLVDADNPSEAVLGDVLGLAALATGASSTTPLVVEWALPLDGLDSPVERRRFDEAGDLVELRRRCLVVRRLAPRLRALQEEQSANAARWRTNIDAWRQIAESMRQRFDRHGLRLLPLSVDQLGSEGVEPALSSNPLASCVVLSQACQDGRLGDTAARAIKTAALPFACWGTDDLSAADLARLEADLDGHAGQDTFGRLHVLQREDASQRHPAARLLLFWDDPLHVPSSIQLKAGSP